MKPMFLLLKIASSSSSIDVISILLINTFPLVGLSNPPSKFKRVDFPLPELPTIAINSWLLIFKLMLSTAFTV